MNLTVGLTTRHPMQDELADFIYCQNQMSTSDIDTLLLLCLSSHVW
jgi:hypothetical protein